MKVPLLDLKGQYQIIKDDIRAVTDQIFESQYFIGGPHVDALENDIAAYCRTEFAAGVSSGTDALVISLMAAGIGRDDLVLTTPYTFFATAGSIVRVGARPVFADIDPDTYTLSMPSMEQAISRLSGDEQSRLKAIIPVHLYGQCADMDSVLAIARQHNLIVIEDAAQAIGAEYKGRRAGSMGDFGCFSFFPSKNLGAFGDGGVVTTSDSRRYDMLKMLRNHGASPKYYHRYIGGNFRLDALQAAVVSIKLKYLDRWTEGRQTNAAIYRDLFGQAGLGDVVSLPEEKQSRHIYNQFIIRVKDRRDELKQYLLDAGVGTEIYYPVPLHIQDCFANLGYRAGDLPAAEAAAAETLALPIYPELIRDQLEYVVETIRGFYS